METIAALADSAGYLMRDIKFACVGKARPEVTKAKIKNLNATIAAIKRHINECVSVKALTKDRADKLFDALERLEQEARRLGNDQSSQRCPETAPAENFETLPPVIGNLKETLQSIRRTIELLNQ
ncbi:hypothetical protein [Noviherbaspirillum humi]|uniref:hypothetical protein n=1 Tax=Noviherbaspirillum humi TaxID=1688639 RepID=UPI000B777AF7|nr:hypothetical protein [Noviherbaspirillum humi]